MASSRRVFLGLYAASGAAALVYEVTWTRLLTLQLGHTVAAASTVLAAFMGGLAVGAWIAGTWNGLKAVPYERSASTPRVGDGLQAAPILRAYAILELIVGASAIALPFALAASTPALAWAYADGAAPARFALVRVAISLALLGVPAAAMGATFPIATSYLALSGRESLSVSAAPDLLAAGALYAANTAGAAAGAIAAGFFLIPAIGLRATIGVGVALNLVAAGGAWWISGAAKTAETAKTAKTTPAADAKPSRRSRLSSRPLPPLRASRAPRPALAYGVVAVSGFAALAYEVAWTRLLALVIGPTTYAFATMAAAFISGLAIGSAIGARIARRAARPAVWLGAMLIVSGTAATVGAYVAATRVPLLVAAEVADPNVAFGRLVFAEALGTALLLLPMTLALGATFPLALAVASAERVQAGREAARVYAANTAGAIAGALAAGFALVPTLGLRSTFITASILGVTSGAVCLTVASGKARAIRTALGPAVVAIVAVAAIVLLPSWDRELLASGAYKYAPYLGSADFDALLRAGRLEYYAEGAASTVSVRRLAGTTSLSIDGKVDASNAGDMLTQRLLSLLPVLLHGRAREIAIVGLGSGVTAGSALASGTVERADVVEISPDVVEASHFFDRESAAPLSSRSVRLIVGDGRSHLLLTPRRYDVIVSEPSNPWMAGVATLFTREFFQAARARLKPDGLLCQWAHTYDISAADLQSIVRTFGSVFPQGTLWLVGEGDLLLIGSPSGRIEDWLPHIADGTKRGTVAETLASVGVAPASAVFDLLSLYAGGPRDLDRYAANAALQTDDRTALEYSAPRAIYGKTTGDNAAAIRQLGGDLPASVRAVVNRASDADWASRGRMELRADAHALAYDAFRRAVTLNPRNADALAGLSDAAAGGRRQEEERAFLESIVDREPGNAPARTELSRLLASGGDFEGAVARATEALRLSPDDPRAGEQLASVVADAGDAARLGPLAESLAARFPGRPDPQYYRASALFLAGRTEDALVEVRHVVESHQNHARAQNLLGAACAMLGRRDCARAAFEASLRANPRDVSTYVNVGQFSLQTGNPQQAADFFAEALTIDPNSTAARAGLSQARALLGANPR